MLDWAEKHRPTSLKEVAGNTAAIRRLRAWAQAWETGRPPKRAVVLAGDPGIGKTSAALALAEDFGWGVIEMNASDKRNAAAVRQVATRGALYETFTDEGTFLRRREGGLKLIILDEADNLFGREDYGGIGAIADTIRETGQPIVLVVNDYYELTRRSSALKRLAQKIDFRRPRPEIVMQVLRHIAAAEGVRLEEEVLTYLADCSGGDLRSAINDLQALAVGREVVREEDLLALGYRDERTEVFQALSDILRSGDLGTARQSTVGLDEDPERLIMWIDENLPHEYRDLEDLERGLGALARADEYLGRVRRSRRYALWKYASDWMTGGVAVAREGSYAGSQYRFPLWLVKMSRSRFRRATADSLLGKMGDAYHVSRQRARLTILPLFARLFRTEESFRFAQAARLDLNAREIAFVLGEKQDSKAVKRVLEGAESLRGGSTTLTPFSRFEAQSPAPRT
ncbi:MAG: replication factor C large subunit [Thermoplasmata archaeon]